MLHKRLGLCLRPAWCDQGLANTWAPMARCCARILNRHGKITELKGSTSITHIFTSPGQPSTACSPQAPSRPHRHQGTPQEKRHSGCGIKRPASQLDMLYSAQASGSPNGCFASSLRAGWGVDGMEETAAGGVRAVVVDVGKQPQQDSAWGTLGPCPMLTGLPLPSAPPLDLGLSPQLHHPLQPPQGQRETQQLLDALSGVVKHLNTPVYNVPTIGICRAEQREKAALKLGLSLHCLPSTNHHPNHQSYSTQPTSPQGLASIGEVGTGLQVRGQCGGAGRAGKRVGLRV
ncbi:hypothetical protein HaLaN_12707 [Haematococcus lacustris]|uniref:Uncharacterized protein n=1 Tax=Haematococcus lacustris TaxID=44745 RepID=A0A699ZBQ2_HAELA|nr:hypothetical protein HaLaN_12707 [Haematococcus lacustris]